MERNLKLSARPTGTVPAAAHAWLGPSAMLRHAGRTGTALPPSSSLPSIANSPRMAAQRKLIQGLFGESAQLMGGSGEELLQEKLATVQREVGAEYPSGISRDHVNAHPVQCYAYQRGTTLPITMSGGTSKKVKQFDICTSNKVTYTKGDKRQAGTGTGTADWKGWLIDLGTQNSATQLHVVNQEWGGLGGAQDGNVGPGSQTLNGKHKGPETKFKGLFDSNGIANYDMTYACTFSYASGLLPYNGATIAQDVQIPDPDISCDIEADDRQGTRFGEGWMVPGASGSGMKIHDGG